MNRSYLNFFFITIFLLGSILFSSCETEEIKPDDDNNSSSGEYSTGVDYNQEQEGAPYIPRDLSLVTLSDATTVLGSAASLEPWVPPVRSQGSYGTCTAWACGYYARSIMYAREHNLSKADLDDDHNVFSPLDLFLSIDSRGDSCNGSWSGAAFEVMQNRGIATLATAPYENLGICSGTPQTSWTQEAASYKIDKYRVVDHTHIEGVKSYLQLGRPVQVSCLLGLDFFSISDDMVLYTDDYSAPSGTHGRHAMVVVGYDDNKGANGAFRIVNSWGENWGDQGYFWVDYDFFASKFCYSAYVIDGDKGGLADALVDESVINPNYRVPGKDLLAVRLTDEFDDYPGNPPQARALTYNVFNRGEETIPSSDNWNIVYYYYNAYNPEEDYGIIIYDSFTNEVGSPGEYGDFEDLSGNTPQAFGHFNWWNNVDIPSGYSAAKAVYGQENGYDYDFLFYYHVPDITGEYYFVLYADGFNAIEEQYEQNNFMFFTGQDNEPLSIVNGVIQEQEMKTTMVKSAFPAELKANQPNAYDIDEIAGLIQHQKENGMLDEKAAAYENKPKFSSTGRGYVGKQIIEARLPR